MFQFTLTDLHNNPSQQTESCKRINHYVSPLTYRIVDRCIKTAVDSLIADYCANTSLSTIGNIPVTNLKNGITFQNVYCAICHGQHTGFTRWQLSINCNAGNDQICQIIIMKPTNVSLNSCIPSKLQRNKRNISPSQDSGIPLNSFRGFAEMLNFGMDGSTRTLYTSNAKTFWHNSKCSDGQIYDWFNDECLKWNHAHKSVQSGVVQRDRDVACIDFHISYTLNNTAPFTEDYIKQSLGKEFLEHYQINAEHAVILSQFPANYSHCTDARSINHKYVSWNSSVFEGISKINLQYSKANVDRCSGLNDKTGQLDTLVVSLKFTELHSELKGPKRVIKSVERDKRANDEAVCLNVKDAFGDIAGYARISLVETHTVQKDWCQGFKRFYVNNEFEILRHLTMHASNRTLMNITGIRIVETNITYPVSQFQFTVVTAGILNRTNISQIASTCDELPKIRTSRGLCDLRLPLFPEKYELLQNLSIKVKFFEELSKERFPYDSEPRPPIQSIFNSSEYEFVLWNGTSNTSHAHSESNLLEDQTVAICLPIEYYALLVELHLWNSITVGHSCAFLVRYNDGSSIAGVVFSCVSTVAMILMLLTYSIFSTLRTLPGISLMNLTVAIMLSQVAFFSSLILSTDLEDKNYKCFIIAVLTHYWTLCSFMWMNVLAYSSYRAFGANLKTRISHRKHKQLLFNSLYGWGFPAIIVLVCAVVDYLKREQHLIQYGVVSDVKIFAEHNKTSLLDDIKIRFRTMSICWIGNSKAALVLFGVPLLYSVLVNVVLFVKTCIGMSIKHYT